MKVGIPLLLLVVATSLQAGGDAIIRIGLKQPHAPSARALIMVEGAVVLFCYGLTLNLDPLDGDG